MEISAENDLIVFRRLMGTYGFDRLTFAKRAGISYGQLSKIYNGHAQLVPYQWRGLIEMAKEQATVREQR